MKQAISIMTIMGSLVLSSQLLRATDMVDEHFHFIEPSDFVHKVAHYFVEQQFNDAKRDVAKSCKRVNRLTGDERDAQINYYKNNYGFNIFVNTKLSETAIDAFLDEDAIVLWSQHEQNALSHAILPIGIAIGGLLLMGTVFTSTDCTISVTGSLCIAGYCFLCLGTASAAVMSYFGVKGYNERKNFSAWLDDEERNLVKEIKEKVREISQKNEMEIMNALNFELTLNNSKKAP